MKKLLAIVIVCFIVATSYIAYVITQRQAMLKNVAHHNDSWAVSQSVSEYMRLEHRLAAYGLGVESSTLDEVRLRLDIMIGRLDILQHGTLRQLIDADPHQQETLDRLHQVLTKLEAGVYGDAPLDVRAMLAEMADLDGAMTAMASYAAEYDAQRIDTQYEALTRLHRIYTGLAGGLIVCGISLIVLLLYHNRLLNRAHDGMQVLAADLRIASSSAPTTAWAYTPGSSAEAGDVWFGTAKGYYSNPTDGNYAKLTFIHELGHALGLGHPHQSVFGAGGHYLLVQAYRLATTTALAPFPYSQMVWMIISGWLVFHQFPDRWTLLGAAIIVASGLYIIHREHRLRVRNRAALAAETDALAKKL